MKIPANMFRCAVMFSTITSGVVFAQQDQTAATQPSPDKLTRMLVQMGWSDLDSGEPDLARQSFRRALRRSPNDAGAINGLGMALIELDQADEALAVLEPAMDSHPEDADLAAVLGQAYLAADRPLDAIAAFDLAKSLRPDWPQVDTWLGTAHLRAGRLVSALGALGQDKTAAPDAQLAKSIALMRLGMRGQARTQLGSLIDGAPGTGWAQAAAILQDQLDEEASGKRLHGSIKVAQYHDSNPGLVPLTDVFGATTNEEKSFGTLTSGQFVYDLVRGDKTDVAAGYSILYTANYSSHNFDLHDHAVFAAAAHRGLWNNMPYQVGMRVDYDYLFVGQMSFLQRVSATPTFTLTQNDQTSTTAMFRYSMLDFLGQGIDQDTADDQDSNNYLLGLTQAFLLPWDNATLELGYQFDTNLAQGSNFDYNGHRLIIGFNWPLPVADMNLAVVGSAHLRLYNLANTFDLKRRRDAQYSLSTVLTCPIEKNLNIILEYSLDRTDSNLTFNDFTRHVFSMGVEYRF